MKINKLLIFLSLVTPLNSIAQSISPSVNNDYCPLTNTTFTVTLPGTGYSSPNVIGWADNVPANVAPGSISGITTSGGNSSFTFVGSFADDNNTHAFRVTYTLNGQQSAVVFKYPKIRSFLTTVFESIPQPNPSSIPASRCQSQNFNIAFNNVQYANPWINPKQIYGTATSYEYLLPIGWILNGTTSTGSNWIAGTNNVTVTSDLSHGDQGSIQVRAVNSCSANLIKGPIATIPVSRPRPTLSITGDNFICSGSKSYSISGTLPPGATVCWSSSNTNYATVPSSPNNCGTSISVTYVNSGVINLTANVTDCIETYQVTKDILIGAAVGGYYRIHSDYHNYGIFNTLYNNNSTIWLPANKGFGIDVWLNSPGIQSATWSRAGTSYPFNWNTSGTFLSFSGTSGTTAYQQRNGIFNLSAQTTCGAVNATYTWPIVVQGWGSFQISTSPNPAEDFMTVTISEESPEVTALSTEEDVAIQIYTLDQGRLVKQWKFKNDQKQLRLNVSNIQKGQYIIVIKKGKYKESKQVIIGK